MQIEFHVLEPPVPPEFRAMTYGLHGEELARPDLPLTTVPLAALHQGRGLGFGLAQVSKNRPEVGEILSLYVEEPLWGRGVGTKLLEELERALQLRGCTQATIGYSTEAVRFAALERIMAKRGWSEPRTHLLLARINPGMVDRAEWVRITPVPSGYEIFPWRDITEEERAALRSVWRTIPLDLWPFQEETIMEPRCSLGLRRDGEVVGWMICHRVASNLIRFSSLYVREPWRRAAVTFGLLAEAIRRKDSEVGRAFDSAIAVRIENEPMLRLMERKFRPFALSWNEMRQAGKPLVTSPSQAELESRAAE